MNIERLKGLMDETGTSQMKLAEVAGVSQAFMSYVMNGYKIPSVNVIVRIAKHFHVTVDELL